MNKPAELPITAADRQQTPVAVQVLAIGLWERVRQLECWEMPLSECWDRIATRPTATCPSPVVNLCWAHLLRDFQAMADRDGVSASVGKPLLEHAARIFTWWHCVRDGTLERSTFRSYMSGARYQVHLDLWYGTQCRRAATAATCREILKVKEALWTFVRREGVEPTNNAAERPFDTGCCGARAALVRTVPPVAALWSA